MANAVSSREFRVSDAEREHVVGLLQKAIGRGLLTLEEFTERTDVALASRTRAELNVVLADLPGMTHPDMRVRGGGGAGGGGSYPVPPGAVVLTGGIGSSITRTGNWEVPRAMVVRSRFGSACNLDFSQATISHSEVHVHLDVTGGAVSMRLPAGASATVSGLNTKIGASVSDKVGYNGTAGGTHFVITGELSMAALTIKAAR